MNAHISLIASVLFALVGGCSDALEDATSDGRSGPSGEGADAPAASQPQCMAYLLQSEFAVAAVTEATRGTVEACLDAECERFPLESWLRVFGPDPRSRVDLLVKALPEGSQIDVVFGVAERPKGTRSAVQITLRDETGAQVGGERGTIEWDYAPWAERPVPAGSEAFSCHTIGNVIERSAL